jgi:hypothetical protein
MKSTEWYQSEMWRNFDSVRRRKGSDRTRQKVRVCVESKRKDPAISENPQKFTVQKDTKND